MRAVGVSSPRLAEFLAFLRRRVTGEYAVDEYGFDPEITDRFFLSAIRPIAEKWFRVEVRGIENIPTEGGALVVSGEPLVAAEKDLVAHLVGCSLGDELTQEARDLEAGGRDVRNVRRHRRGHPRRRRLRPPVLGRHLPPPVVHLGPERRQEVLRMADVWETLARYREDMAKRRAVSPRWQEHRTA